MKRMRFPHHDSSRIALVLVATGLILVPGVRSLAGEDFRTVKGIEGFSAVVATRNVDPASISDAKSVGAGGAERLAWGQSRCGSFSPATTGSGAPRASGPFRGRR